MSFDPLSLDSLASVNRTRLAALPFIEASLHGRQAAELLSSKSISSAVQAAALDLGLPAGLPPDRVLPWFGDCLTSDDSRVRDSAVEIARQLGRYLGCVIATLVLDQSVPELADYRRHWSGIQTVWLGGGVVSGALGQAMHAEAASVLRQAALARLRLSVAGYAQQLPLIGAALSGSEPNADVLVYDFGTTYVKRGRATVRNARLVRIDLLPLLTLPSWPASPDDVQRTADDTAAFMAATIAGDLLQTNRARGSPIVAAVASYIRDGQPVDRRGVPYGLLGLPSGHASHFLSAMVSEATGAPVTVILQHDGTTAARVFAGQEHTAVLMLGTSLGVGFAPEGPLALSLAPEFRLEAR